MEWTVKWLTVKQSKGFLSPTFAHISDVPISIEWEGSPVVEKEDE